MACQELDSDVDKDHPGEGSRVLDEELVIEAQEQYLGGDSGICGWGKGELRFPFS